MTTQALPYIILLGVFWGSTLVASRFSVGQFDPTTYIGLRLLFAGLSHVVGYVALRRYRWPRGRSLWLRAMVLGVLGTAVPMTAIVVSLQYLSSGIASLLITANPALTVLFAHFFLSDEKLTTRKVIGVALALIGAASLALRGESGLAGVDKADPLGYGLMAVAMLAGSSMTIYTRKYLRDYRSYDVASIRMWVATLVVLPLSLLFVGFDVTAVTPIGYTALLYAALIGTFAGMLLSFYNIKRFGATASAMTSYIIPIVASIGGALLLDEQITLFMVGGMGLILVGVALINERTAVVRPQTV